MTRLWRRCGAGLAAAFALLAVSPVAQAHQDHDAAPASEQTRTAPADHQGMEGMVHDPSGTMAEAMTPDAPPPVPKTFSGRLLDWLGRWHPSIVHFPIALFVVTAVLEAASRVFRRPQLAEGARLSIALAAISAVVAIGLGWLAMGVELAKDDQLHQLHRWIGSGLGVLALLAWWAKEAHERRPTRGRGLTYGIILAATVVFILINGYLGGGLVHGANHMAF